MAAIVTCPACNRQLQVPEAFFGKTVQCPECKQAFLAEPVSAAAAAVGVTASQPPTADAPAWDKPPARRRAWSDDGDDRPDDADRPRRRLAPHRGGMILAFGILSLFVFVFGPLAWIMGNADLMEMRAGRMDPSGESQTNTGRIIGMVSVYIMIGSLLLGCLIGAAVMVLVIVGSAAHG